MRYQEFFLTDDAVDDLAKLEAYVLSYQSTSFIEILEDRFFEAFHGLLTLTSRHFLSPRGANPNRRLP